MKDEEKHKMSVEEARELLPDIYQEVSDNEIKKLINFFMRLAKTLVDHYYK